MVEVIDDAVLGRLVYDDAGEWYEGKAEITPGHDALLYVCPEPGVTSGLEAAAIARGTLARLRQADAQLRRSAAEELVASYPDRVSPLTAEGVAASLWAAVVFFWDDGGARVDWDADPHHLLGWSSCNWATQVDSEGRPRKSGWE